jgi:hypothetical protein
MLTQEQIDKCTKLFEEGASRVKTWPDHWIHYFGDSIDYSIDYCYECAKKHIEVLRKEYPDEEFVIDGGWGSESDGFVFCEDCGRLLDTSVLGCDDELAYFMEYGIEGDLNLYSMNEVINSGGWDLPTGRTWRNDRERESKVRYYKDLHEVCREFLEGNSNE